MFLEDVGMTSVIFKVGMLALVSTIVFLVRIVQSLKRLPNSWNKYLALTELCQMTIGGLSTQIFDGKYSLIYFLLVLAWIEPSISQCIGTNTRDFGVWECNPLMFGFNHEGSTIQNNLAVDLFCEVAVYSTQFCTTRDKWTFILMGGLFGYWEI